MSVNRRSFFKCLGGAGAALATGGRTALAREASVPPTNALGLLFDATKCIGCKTCMVACRKANGLSYEEPGALWDSPIDLSGRTKNIIKLYREGETTSYVKRQCMHCVDPACVSVCMFGAMHKGDYGIVEYDPSRCVGCRYCQVACQFNIPKFEWDSPVPKIVKCELCRHLVVKGQPPACAAVCPTGAVKFGKRSDLLTEAKQRIARHADKYIPKVYGETDAGGTQVLYLSAVPFEKLGLPLLGDDPVPKLTETVQHGVYQGFIAPVALYALLVGVLFRNRSSATHEETTDQEGDGHD